MTGYNDNPEATAAAIDRHGWLHTGDLGTMDAQGFVRITGRVKDMIIRGGENYFPAKIEAALVSHPDVLQVAVVDLRAHCQGVLSAQKKTVVVGSCTRISPDGIWKGAEVCNSPAISHR